MKKSLLIVLILFLVSCAPVQTVQPNIEHSQPEPALEVTTTPFPTAKPDDFQIEYYWEVGSLPEPYFYYYVITVGPGTEGTILFSPDYASNDPPEWQETFPVNAEQLEQLYTQLLTIGALTEGWLQSADIPDGGSAEKMQITAYGQSIAIPSFVDGEQNARDINEVYDTIGNLVSPDIWEKLNTLHQEYVAAHEE